MPKYEDLPAFLDTQDTMALWTLAASMYRLFLHEIEVRFVDWDQDYVEVVRPKKTEPKLAPRHDAGCAILMELESKRLDMQDAVLMREVRMRVAYDPVIQSVDGRQVLFVGILTQRKDGTFRIARYH
jgi:hypothetical protein